MRLRPRNLFLVTALFLGLAGPRSAAAVVVGCGDVVPRGEVGELAADLDCADRGLVLEHGATLKLNGHVVAGPGASPSGCLFPLCGGVWCQGSRCTVEGPGEVTGYSIGIWSQHPTRLRSKGTVQVTDVAVHGNGTGIRARIARLTDVVVQGNTTGIVAERSKLLGVEASANTAEGIVGHRADGDGVRVETNGGQAGILIGSARLENAVITGNGGDGIHATRRIALLGSVVTGNAGADLSTPVRPMLSETTCGSSSNQAGGDWDVCADD
jgi:hypothetical protein